LSQYVVIEGIIGAGKTSLAELLARRWNAQLVLEEFAENPFLPKFYEDPGRYAFPLELQKQVFQTGNLFQPKVVADYFLPKCQIFAKNNLEEEEYKLFLRLFEIMQYNVPQPDLLVYLHLDPSQALKNIQKRGRSYEQNINFEYLNQIQKNYLSFIQQHTNQNVLMIRTDELDFVQSDNDLRWIVDEIEKERAPGIHRVDPKF
jgi:deoxyguanosine kinase